MSIVIEQKTFKEKRQIGNLPEVLQRIYLNRGITELHEISRGLKDLIPFNELKDIDKFVKRMVIAIKNQEKILIVGDFDADGATSTALAVKGLTAMGAKHVDFIVPNRFDFGYGLSKELVLHAENSKKPNLIITVDNGIANEEGVFVANSLGIDVLITDHHLAGDKLPKACAIINPNQPNCNFPSKSLAGVGVIFYCLLALRSNLREIGFFADNKITEPNLADYLDLVALGTVADVVPLDKNNRILVYQGIERIKRGLACYGINALLAVANRDIEHITASDLGFAVGPRLNAAGRLEDMSFGIACLLAKTRDEALVIASELNELNNSRRVIESDMQEQAIAQLQTLSLDEQNLPCAICLFADDWHQGVVGLLAARIKEKLHRPTICFAKSSSDSKELKGSARSIPGCHIRDILALISVKYPNLICKFGGHSMAAGLSIKEENFTHFQKAFNETVKNAVDSNFFLKKIITDGELYLHELTINTAKLLSTAGPFGQGFPYPVFDDIFEVANWRLLAEKHLKITLKKDGAYFDAIAFFANNNWLISDLKTVRIVYKLDINRYQGQEKLQLIIEHLEHI